MARYRYVGPGPIEALSGGEIIRPGDEREFGAEPGWGPWDLLDEPESEPEPAQTGPVSVSLPAAVAGIEPAKPEGM